MAALTVASIYIPMALSLAANLAHAPPVNGLYSFVIHPFIYAILGSCPLLVLGPEAAGSLLTGAIVKSSVRPDESGDLDNLESSLVIGISTAMTGAMILAAGLTRLGFLDNMLSRPFLRGFITAIGFVIFVDQLIPELGLGEQASDTGASHGTTVEKLLFVFRYGRESHGLTAAVSIVSFAIIMIFRFVIRLISIEEYANQSKDTEKMAGTTLPSSDLLSRSFPSCSRLCYIGMAIRLGRQGSRAAWSH